MFNKHSPRRRLARGALALAGLWIFSPAAQAAEPDGRLEVHDVSVWMIDRGATTANTKSAHPSALPVTVPSSRDAQPPNSQQQQGIFVANGFAVQSTTGVAAPAERRSMAARRAAPINLITFHGQPAANLDVDVRTRSGSFLAHWPPGDGLPNRLRWFGTPPFNLVEKIDDEAELVFVDSDNWMEKARQGEALFVKRGARAERFLAYDLELNLTAPVRLEGGPDSFRVINISGATLYDVLVARDTPEGRRVAWIDELPASEPAAAASPATPAEKSPPEIARPKPSQEALRAFVKEKPRAAKLFGGLPIKPEAAKPEAPKPEAPKQEAVKPEAPKQEAAKPEAPKKEAVKPEAVKPAAAPQAKLFGGLPKNAPAAKQAAQKADPKPTDARPAAAANQPPGLFGGLPAPKPGVGVEVTLSAPLPADSPEAAAATTQALADRLAKAGLAPHESEQFVDHYAGLLFARGELMVACRLERATIDEKVPLSIFPAPAKTVRVAMVFLRNADPQMGHEVEQLVKQLGDPQWTVREAAQKRLLELGPVAYPALNKALSSSDPEIVIRAERILLKQNQTPNAPAGAAGLPPGVFRLQGGRVLAAPVIINR